MSSNGGKAERLHLGSEQAVRFSGFAGPDSLDQQEAQLRVFMTERGLFAASTPKYAFYNAPWTLPVMRRNEIMIEIAGK